MPNRKINIEIQVVKGKRDQLDAIALGLERILKIADQIQKKDIDQVIKKIVDAVTSNKNALKDVADEWKKIADSIEKIAKNASKAMNVLGKGAQQQKKKTGKPTAKEIRQKEFGGFLATVFKANAFVAVISGRLIPALLGAGVALQGTSVWVKALGAGVAAVTVIVQAFVAALQFTILVGKLTAGFIALTGAVVGLFAAFQIRKLGEFATQLRKTSNLLIGTGESVRRLADEARALTLITGRRFGEVLEGQFQAVTTGARDAEIRVAALTEANKLMMVSGGDLATNVNLLTTIMEAYGFKASELTNISKTLFGAVSVGNTTMEELSNKLGPLVQIAGAFGFAFDETLASVVKISKGSKNATVAITQMKNVLNTLIKVLTTDTVKARKFKSQIAALGVETDIAKVRQQGLVETWLQLASAFKQNETVVSGMFGDIRALAGAASILSDDASGVVKDLAEMEKLGENLSEAYIQTRGEFDALTSSIGGLLEVLLLMGGGPLQIVENVLKAFEVLLTKIVAFVEVSGEGLMGFIDTIIGPFGDFFISTFLNIAEIIETSESWSEILSKSLTIVVKRATPFLNLLVDIFRQTFLAIGNFILKIIPVFLESAIDLSVAFLLTKGKFLILKGLGLIGIGIIEFLVNLLGHAIDATLGIYLDAVFAFVETVTDALDAILEAAGADALFDFNIDEVQFSDVVGDMADKLSDELKAGLDLGIEALGEEAAGKEFEKEAGEILQRTVLDVGQAAGGLGEDLIDIGKKTVDNLQIIRDQIAEQNLPDKLDEAFKLMLKEREEMAEIIENRLKRSKSGNRKSGERSTGFGVPPRRL